MIKRILCWIVRPIVEPIVSESISAAYEGVIRNFVNEQVEGAIGQCQEHATQTAQDAIKRALIHERAGPSEKSVHMVVAEVEQQAADADAMLYQKLIRDLPPLVYGQIVKELSDVADMLKRCGNSGRLLELSGMALTDDLNQSQTVELVQGIQNYVKSPLAAAILMLSAKEFSKQLAQHVAGIEPERLDQLEARLRELEGWRTLGDHVLPGSPSDED